MAGALVGCSSSSPIAGGTAGAGGAGAGGAGAAPSDGGDGPSSDGPSATSPDGACITNAYARNGVCTCSLQTPNACATSCVDLLSDGDNCGACGHACAPTAACAAGVCTPTPTIAVAAAPGCDALSLYAANGVLTWADRGHGTIQSAPTSGTPLSPTMIASGESAPRNVLVAGAKTFWLSSVVGVDLATVTSTIRVSSGGATRDVVSVTAAKLIQTLDASIYGFTVSGDGTTVYFSKGLEIDRAPATGGAAPTEVAYMDNRGYARALALWGDLLTFPIDLNGYVDIAQVTNDVAHCWVGGDDASLDINCTRIAEGQGGLLETSIATDGSHLFWADGQNLKTNVFAANAIRDNQAVASVDAPIAAFVLAGETLYLTESDAQSPATGLVQKVAMAPNSTPTPLARNVNVPDAIAVDGHSVFWSTADCEIQTTATGP